MCDAKRRRKNVRIAWLDLKNAFGSKSHDLLWFMLREKEVPEPFINICKEIYTGSSQRIKTGAGYTRNIPVHVGIKQGCPLSPLLFNFALEALLPALEKAGTGYTLDNGTNIHQLALLRQCVPVWILPRSRHSHACMPASAVPASPIPRRQWVLACLGQREPPTHLLDPLLLQTTDQKSPQTPMRTCARVVNRG